MLQSCSECSRLILQVRYQPHSTAVGRENNDLPNSDTGKVLDQQIVEQWTVNGLLGEVDSIFHFIKVKPSFVKGKNNNKNTQYLIKEPYSHYTVTWQRAIELFQKLTSDSPSPDTAKRKDNKFKKCLYTPTYLNVQDDKTEY